MLTANYVSNKLLEYVHLAFIVALIYHSMCWIVSSSLYKEFQESAGRSGREEKDFMWHPYRASVIRRSLLKSSSNRLIFVNTHITCFFS